MCCQRRRLGLTDLALGEHLPANILQVYHVGIDKLERRCMVSTPPEIVHDAAQRARYLRPGAAGSHQHNFRKLLMKVEWIWNFEFAHEVFPNHCPSVVRAATRSPSGYLRAFRLSRSMNCW